MNFKSHLKGGATTGAIIAGVAFASGYASINQEAALEFFENPLSPGNGLSVLIALFLITLFMSLFPDLDTGSIPQRWFLRASFIALATLFFYGHMEWFAALTFITILPMLHKHRGWTHFKITPFILLSAIAFAHEYSAGSSLTDFFRRETLDLIQNNWPYILACVSGHYTHLLLDYLGGRRFSKSQCRQ